MLKKISKASKERKIAIWFGLIIGITGFVYVLTIHYGLAIAILAMLWGNNLTDDTRATKKNADS